MFQKTMATWKSSSSSSKPMRKFALILLTATALIGCGSNSDRISSDTQTGNSVDYLAPDISALNSQYVEISILNVNTGTFQWQQTAGQKATIIDGENSASLRMLTPSNVVNGEQLTFHVEHSEAGTVTTGAINIKLNACDAGPDDLFIDCVAPTYGALRSYEAESDHPDGVVDGIHFNGNGYRHINWEMVDTGDPAHNTVIQVHFGANDPLNEINTNGWFGIGTPDDLGPPSVKRIDLSHYQDGAISFDVRQTDAEDGIISLGLECGWPCTSEQKIITTTYDWQTVTVALADFVESGVDLSQLDVAFMFREPWWAQDAHTYQIDNIRMSQSYSRPVINEPPRPDSAETINLLQASESLEIGKGMGITLSNIDSGIQADFASNGGYSWLYTQFTDPSNNFSSFKNLSDYFHGEVVLNYSVNSWGEDTTGGFIVDADCGRACNLFPSIALPRIAAGTTTEVRIPIKEMVARGLVLENVSRIFQLKLFNSQPNGISITIHDLYLELP